MDEQRRTPTRQGGSSESRATAAPPVVEEALGHGGAPLPDPLRADMEGRFAHDFTRVRLHTHALAAASAAAVGARAYTVGADVVFAAGEYAPDTRAGRRLIAHELAHVVQQEAVRPSNNRAAITMGAVDDPLERAAEAAARGTNLAAATIGASAAPGAGRVQHRPVLQRDGGPGEKKEEAPVTRVPYRDKGPSPEGGTEPAGKAADAPPLVPASAARPTCNPTGLTRSHYRAQPHTSSEDFGLTRFAGTVSIAGPTTRKVKGGVMLEPLQVRLPAITSHFTKADTFPEDTAMVPLTDRKECEEGKPPLQWQITLSGADALRQCEMEHCEDLQYAYDLTFGWYGSIIDGLIARRRTFSDRAAALKHLRKLTGADPANWPSVFECLARKTELRDGKKFTNGWHTPQVTVQPPRLKDDCKFARVVVSAANFPDLGKYPTPTVIKGCGESPDAVKALAKKAAAKSAASGEGAQATAERTAKR